MSWRGSTTIPDRIFACLPYLLPLVDSLAFSEFLVQQFPILGIVLLPILPIARIYRASGYGQILVFFALLFFVVRNEK
ncbi:Tic20 family protein, partial [Cylindrospermopsis raciborskii]|uniref:Tic20 family protein n=1 Tax=Cylindrospermopsis raciborskii TaxID=77022 RepID=UPI0038CFBF41